MFRALPGLGDFLCLVPALRALRQAYPDARVAYLGLAAVRPLAGRYRDLIDEFVDFPGFPGLTPEVDLARVPGFLAEMAGAGFDLALQVHGSGVQSNGCAVLLGARRTAGFYLPGQFCPDEETFLPYPTGIQESQRHLELVRHLTGVRGSEEADWGALPGDEDEARPLTDLPAHGPGTFVCINPGASDPSRRWPVDRFAEAARWLLGRGLGITVVGAPADAEVAADLSRLLDGERVVNACGQTSLGALAVLLRRSRLALTNDTGTSHLAAALRVPSVVIFSATDPVRWAPLDRGLHRVAGLGVSDAQTCCGLSAEVGPCLGDSCSVLARAGAREVRFPEVEEVIDALEGLLGA